MNRKKPEQIAALLPFPFAQAAVPPLHRQGRSV